MSTFMSHAQRSFSADDLSPSTSDHEKWEREALTDYLLRARGSSLVNKTRLNRGSGAGRCQDNDRQNNRRRAYEKQRSRSFDLMLGGGYNPCLWSPVEEHKQLSTSKYESISSEEGHPTDYINLHRDNKDSVDGSYSRPPSRKMMPNVRAFVPNNEGKPGDETSIPTDPEYVHGHWIEPGLEQRGRHYLPTNQALDSSSGQEQRSGRNISSDRDRSSHDKWSENLSMNLGVEKQANGSVDVRTSSRKMSPNINRGAGVNEHRSRRKSLASKVLDVDPERRSSVVQNGDKRTPLLRQPASQCNTLSQNIKSGRRDSPAGRRESSAGRRGSSAGRRESSAGRRESLACRRDSPVGKHDGSMGRQLPQIPQENGEVKQRRLMAFHEKKSHSLDSSFEEYMDDNAEISYTSHHHSLSVQQRRARMMHEKSYSLDMPYVHHEVEFTRGSRRDLDGSEQWHDATRHVSYGDARTYAQPPFEHGRVPVHSDIVPSSEHVRTVSRGANSSVFARSATFISSGQEQRPVRNAPSSHCDRDRSSHDKRSELLRQQYPGAEFYNSHHQVESKKLDEKQKKNREKITTSEGATSHSRHVSQAKNAPQQQVVNTKKVPSKLDLHKTRVDMQHKDRFNKAEKSDGTQEKSGLHKTAQEKRFHQFRQQKSYSYEMPYELERYEDAKLPTESHEPLTAQGRRRRHFHQQKSHSCEVPQAAPPSAAHNEAVWMQPERRYLRMAEAEGYTTPSPTRSPRSPRDTGNVPVSDLPVRSPRSPRDSGHFPLSDGVARSPRSPRDTGHGPPSDVTTRLPRSPRDPGHLPLDDLPVTSPRSPRDTGHVPFNEVTSQLQRSPRDASDGKNEDGKRIKNLAEREADFWKKKRMEFYQQQRSCSFAGHSSDDDRNEKKDVYKNNNIVTDMLAQIAKEHGSYTGDEQLMTKLQEAINVEVRQQHSRSTRMQRFREQKSHSLNVDSSTKPLPLDRGPLEVGERNRNASSSHASRRDIKSGPNNHKLMSLHSMKSIKTDDHVHSDKTDVSTSKQKSTLTKQSSRASSGSRESSRTRSPHPSSSIPRLVGDAPRTSGRRQEAPTTDAATTPQTGNGNSHKALSAAKLGTGLRKGCCITPSGGSSDYSESFEHQPHCMMSTPPDTPPSVCYENCTDDVVGVPRRSQMVSPDENIAGVPSPSTQRLHHKKLNLRMKSFSVDSDNPPVAPPAVIDQASKSKSHSSGSFTNLLVAGGLHASSVSPTMQHRGSRGRLPGFINPDFMHIDEAQRIPTNLQRSPTLGNSSKVARNTSTHNLYVALYGFKGREKDDLDLRARWRVTVTDMSDTDWWKGRCNGKTGYFPASYVTKVYQREKVLQVVSGLETSNPLSSIKLRKDQIVIQEGPEENGMIPIRTSDLVHFPCPAQYLAEVDS